MAKQSACFDVKLTEDERKTLASDLCDEIQNALDARQAVIGHGGTMDLMDWYYEQGKSDARDLPFPGAADLTSYLIREKVDGMVARIDDTINGVEPFCTVDGWGADSQKAAAVEAFHEWQVDEEGLKEELSKVALGALLEDCFVLEVRERIETKRVVEEVDVALAMDGESPVFSDGQPELQTEADGEPVMAQPGQASAKVKRSHTKTRRLGPEYDAISMKDYVLLPGHAKNRRQVWGDAKRFFLRVSELNERAADDIYDKDAVANIGTQSDREDQATLPVADVAPQQGESVEKELFEMCLKRDLDGDGREEWYVVTLSIKHREILRLKLDTLVMKIGKSRRVPFVLLPRRNSVYGYSYAEMQLTLAEEHTSLRNMKADRGALATNKPIKRTSNSKWDPELEPFGVGRVITVGDMNELMEMEIADVPSSIVEQERSIIGSSERLSGQSDMSLGFQATAARTLGENQMVQQGSAVRVKKLINHFRRSVAVVMEIRHAIWEEALASDAKGLEAPASVVQTMQLAGQTDFSGRFTADMLKGKYRFKPYGSVDTADSPRQMQYFNQWLELLGKLSQLIPSVQMMMQSPDVLKSIMQEGARVYKVRNPEVFMKALQQPMQGMLPPAGGMDAGGAQPGMGAQPPGIEQLLASLGGGQRVQ